MAVSLVLIIVGLVLLTYSADHFVVGAGRVALRMQISAVVVGAVVVGFGTSAPEFLVSTSAAARGDFNLGAGNVIGSVIANLTLVLGVVGLMGSVVVSKVTLRREAPLSVAAVVSFAYVIQGAMTPIEGMVLLIALVGSLIYLVRAGRADGEAGKEEIDRVLEDLDLDHWKQIDMRIEGFRTIAGLIGTIIGSQILVEGALDLADRAGVSSGFVGVSLVALGTSLPELVTSVAAARRGSSDLVIGNLLGSNMFNGFGIGAAMALFGPGKVTDTSLTGLGAAIMVGVVLLSVTFMATSRVIERWEAVVLIVVYLVTIPLLGIDSSDDGDNDADQATGPTVEVRGSEPIEPTPLLL
ncbi:MAG: calcium/sodium antiporter [Acidobacteria bacterium]|nr:calcium/sodium antiporter [Acidobacteriota bacterium]